MTSVSEEGVCNPLHIGKVILALLPHFSGEKIESLNQGEDELEPGFPLPRPAFYLSLNCLLGSKEPLTLTF